MKIVVDKYPTSKSQCPFYNLCGTMSPTSTSEDEADCNLTSSGCRLLTQFETELNKYNVHRHHTYDEED